MNKNSNTSPILVTGSHRSGSTWVGQVLSEVESLGYMHEPLNPIYPTPKSAPINLWYLYIGEHNHNTYYNYFKETLKWNYQSGARFGGIDNTYKAKMWLKYANIFRKNKGKTPLVKDPIAFFSAPWLAKNFNMQVVSLTRHPAAFAYSLIRKDWKFPFKHLLRQHELMEQVLPQFKKEITDFAKEEKPLLEQACLVWRILYATSNKYQKEHKDWIFLRHEDLSANPTKAFKDLFSRLGLEFSPKVEAFVKESSGSENQKGTVANEEQLKRDSAANIKYWKDKLSVEDIEKIKDLTKDIWPLFYTEADW